MERGRRVDDLDLLALASAMVVLAFAYVVYPHQVIQFAAWGVVFCIWMVWFVYYGTRRYYGVDR